MKKRVLSNEDDDAEIFADDIVVHGWDRLVSPAEYPDFDTGRMACEGWVILPMNMIVRLRSEKADPRLEGDLPFVGMDDIEAHGLHIMRTRPFAEMRSAGNRFCPGDVLYGRLRPYLNKTAIASGAGACSGELLVLEPTAAVDSRYLQYFLHSRRFVGLVSATTSGDRPRVRFETITGFAIPLAPLPEQRRIAARVDALFAEVAAGEATLAAARKGLETFRRALLKAAVSGELTKDWREVNSPSETGHDVLARVIKLRAAKTSVHGRGRRSAKVDPLENDSLPELPDSWAWATVAQIVTVRTGSTPSRGEQSYWNSGSIPWFTSAATNAPFARTANEKITELALLETSCKIYPPGTLLVAMYGEGKTRGQITELAIPGACNQACAALLFSAETECFREWIKRWFESFYFQLRAQAAGGVQPNLNLDTVKSLTIPIPPPAEAAEILRRVADALAAVADTQALLDAEAADAARLRQSILKAAFAGRLSVQDPADEPAHAMLARLRQRGGLAPRRRGGSAPRAGRPKARQTEAKRESPCR
jgi:type I restriction enzyme S subunit